jgi:hypothetical protein
VISDSDNPISIASGGGVAGEFRSVSAGTSRSEWDEPISTTGEGACGFAVGSGLAITAGRGRPPAAGEDACTPFFLSDARATIAANAAPPRMSSVIMRGRELLQRCRAEA